MLREKTVLCRYKETNQETHEDIHQKVMLTKSF